MSTTTLRHLVNGEWIAADPVVNGLNPSGLSAGIVTASLKHARHFTRHVRAGLTMANLPGVDYRLPFGGTRKSRYGPRERGGAAIEFYTTLKTNYSWA